MAHRIRVIYEDGVLRPLSPLELPERSRVEIDIHQVVSAADRPAHRELINRTLVRAGLGLSPIDITARAATPLSPERREQLEWLFSAGEPISELISEDRESR